jgi:uncharacterized phage-associated protein
LRTIGQPITHLKLQKLTFFAYGAVLADDLDTQVGQVDFEAWQHGPVCPPVYEHYKSYGSAVLPLPEAGETYSHAVEQCLRDVIAVYGRLSAWQLREQSHLEEPWEYAWNSGSQEFGSRVIPTEKLRAHFRAKFKTGKVTPPEGLTQIWPLSLDSIPQARFDSLHSLARALA